MAKKIKIIGAGVAGLSAASYLQRNGYDTEIYELHSLPGGLCTAWRKKDYTFDSCIHWLVGSSPSNPIYQSWNEILDMNSLTFVEMDFFCRIDDEHGNSLTLYSDADQLGAELKRHSFKHSETIDELVNGIKTFAISDDKDAKVKEQKAVVFGKYVSTTTGEFAKKLESSFLEFALAAVFGKGPMIGLPFILSTFHQKSAGYPIGGSLKFAQSIEKRYLELGGKIEYNSRVIKILTKNDKACGLKLENGQEVESDLIISAADGYHTIFKLLEGKYLNDTIKGFYAEKNPTIKPNPSWVQISLGIERSFDKEPHEIYFKAKHPLTIDSKTEFEIANARIYKFDPTLAPKGHTVVIGMFNTSNFQYWQDLRRDNREKYEQEKNRIATDYIAVLDSKLGSIKGHVKVIDVSTPATAIRYTNNWRGSFMGWGWGTQIPVWTQRELPNLGNFYMTGHWITPAGGLPTVLKDGKNLARQICEKDGKEFKTSC